MKFRTTLGGIAALMTVGVFYTFAFCMVEDVDESAISVDYYYSTETEAESTVTEAIPQKQDNTELRPDMNNIVKIEPDPIENIENEDEDIQAETEAPVEVNKPETSTYVPAEAEQKETVSAAPETAEEPDEDFPEDFELDEYDDNSAEASELSVYGGDTNNEGMLSAEEQEDADKPEETTAPETEPVIDTPAPITETVPQIVDDIPDISGDIVITILGAEEAPRETTVSVNVGNGNDISTAETFTARFNGSVQTVNAYDLICQIVYNEMSSSFSDEALKAQAVAAYSYVKYHNVNGLTPSVLVKSNPPERVKKLVSEVWGVCCYYNGNVAQTVYMASSSGYTADAKNVWGGNIPYLKSVACPFDSVSDPNYGVTLKVSEDNMRTLLESALGIKLSDNAANWLTVTGYVDGNYVGSLDVDGQKTITGRKMRENVMGYKLKSAAFDVYYSGGYFVFTTYGYGHGVGMSQNGANILAKQGYSYEEILKYYFTGIEVL